MAVNKAAEKAQRLTLRTKAIELYLEGMTISAIARHLETTAYAVRRLVHAARSDLIEKQKDYFDYQITCLLEQKIDTIHEMLGVLGDQEFLRTAATDRIDAITRSVETITNKAFTILAAAGGHSDGLPALPSGGAEASYDAGDSEGRRDSNPDGLEDVVDGSLS